MNSRTKLISMLNLFEKYPNLNYPQLGEKFYEILELNIIKDDYYLEIDMANINCIPSLFLNTSIYPFIQNYGYEKLKGRVLFRNINASISKYIMNYIRQVIKNKEFPD